MTSAKNGGPTKGFTEEEKAAAGCLGLGVLGVLLVNAIWWSFVGWMIYLLVEWMTK